MLHIFVRAMLAYLATAALLLAQNAVPGSDAPRLEFVFRELVSLGSSIHPGMTPLGERNIVPITGGTFSGPNIRGKILPGGWDWQLSTKNGCVTVQANYMLETDDGVVIKVNNRGALCDMSGKQTRHFTSPRFEAPLGRYDWLNRGAYVGTLDVTQNDGKPAVRIRFYKAN